MRKLYVITLAFVLSAAVGCNGTVGVLGVGGVPGATVKTRILEAAQQNTLLAGMILAAGGYSNAMAIAVVDIVIDGMVVPGLAGIDENKSYTEASVADCEESLRSLTGAVLGTWLSAARCDLKSVGILKIGPLNAGGN